MIGYTRRRSGMNNSMGCLEYGIFIGRMGRCKEWLMCYQDTPYCCSFTYKAHFWKRGNTKMIISSRKITRSYSRFVTDAWEKWLLIGKYVNVNIHIHTPWLKRWEIKLIGALKWWVSSGENDVFWNKSVMRWEWHSDPRDKLHFCRWVGESFTKRCFSQYVLV